MAYARSAGGRKHPRGLLVLRGEDYSDPRGNSTFYVDRIKGAIFARAKRCQGHGIVIFDEVSRHGLRAEKPAT